MPGTPSIHQQQIVLALFLVALFGVVHWQNSSDHPPHPVRKFFPAHEPAAFGELDFTHAEIGWSTLQVDAQGNLLIDALTETALVDALAVMQREDATRSTARMAVLLEKQFGVTPSHQIMTLLPPLQRYKESEQRWWAEHGSRKPPPYAELFRLQDAALGESLAQKMFAEQRRLTTLMLSSQQGATDSAERAP